MSTDKTLTPEEITLLREAVACRIKERRELIDRMCGSLYPAIVEGEITRLKALFYKLTGETFEE